MTSFIDLRVSKAKAGVPKDKEELSYSKIVGGGVVSSRVPVQNPELSFSKNPSNNNTFRSPQQQSEITLLKPNKRLEGHDQYKLGVNNDDGKSSSNFYSKGGKNDSFKKNTKQFQNKVPDENIEEEYIKGLQDEIKLLEYELKLLKDKDLEQQASLSQLDKFFNDGVPLNENILAMKNQYNVIKFEGEGRLQKFEEEEKKVSKNNEDLKQDLVKLEEYFDLFGKEIKEKERKYKGILDSLRKDFFEVKHATGEIEKEFKALQGKNRKLQDEIMTFSRAAEKEEVLSTHREETRHQSLQKIKENILEKEKKISEFTKELEELKGNEIVNPAIMHLEKENAENMKKLMMISTEMNSSKARCNDMEYLLEMRAKERKAEAETKRNLNQQLQDLLLHYKEEHNVKEKVLQQKVEEKEKIDIAEMRKRVEGVKTLIELFKQRINRCERECENMIEAKMDVQQKTLDEEQKRQLLDKEFDQLKAHQKETKSGLELFVIQEKENKAQINPLNQEIQEIVENKPKYEEEIKRLKEAINHFLKQIELANHVKKFNLEELKVIAFNNNQVNNKIMEFIQNFDLIQRTSKLSPNLSGK